MKPITNTLRKLGEAEFFIEKLNPIDPYFDYYLSAYLNSARSITWIMRNEYHNNDEWEKWFNNTNISEEDRKLLKDINDLRILSVKQTGIKTEYYFLENVIADENSYPIIKKIQNELKDQEIIMTISEHTGQEKEIEDGKYIVTGKVKMGKDESQKSREKIYELCERYFGFIKAKVNECNLKF